MYGYGYGYGYDWSYLLWVAPGLILSLLASFYVRSTFSRWSQVALSGGRSGAQIAAQLLARAGLHDVRIERIGGMLSDHYDPSARVLRLSPDVHDGRSIAAAGVAAHEVGHAIQHATGYALMGLRQKLIAPARIGSQISYFVIVGGILLHLSGLAWAGVALFGAVLAFEVVTIPVEINASYRAGKELVALGLVTRDESQGVRSVLTAAAFTYIAAMLTTLLTLLFFVSRLRGRRD
jgi:Zn-dependent membrane protease YugP